MKKLWLITGGAGFIGSNIVEELVRRGERVRIIDNFSAGKKDNIKDFMNKIEVVEGDIRKYDDIKKAVKGVDYVLHEAAMRSVPKSVDDPRGANDNNITGTLNVLMAAKEAGVKKLVYASSSSVYGDSKKFPQKEDMFPSPISPYAVSKLAAEYYCVMFSKTFALPTVSLRYFNVFGPKQPPESMYSPVIPKFIKSAIEKKPLEIHWDGKQSRDFTYVANIVKANIIAAESDVYGKVYNVACGATVSLLDIVKLLESFLGYKLEKKFLPKRAGDVRKTCADVSKIKKELGYKNEVNFKDGLKKTLEWFMSNKRGEK
ncbi:MAG: SDR family oxidoreductase [Elusimicrobia bacterium]|jgi:UDP-glucose 4-epimerase|nr:SDR family oxidoreductase [Elusimicrobiota bacterium]